MEIFSALLLAVSPWIIKAITNFIKKFETIRVSENKTFILRFVVAALAFLTAWATAFMNGIAIDANIVQTLAESVVVFLGATGAYFFQKSSEGKIQ